MAVRSGAPRTIRCSPARDAPDARGAPRRPTRLCLSQRLSVQHGGPALRKFITAHQLHHWGRGTPGCKPGQVAPMCAEIARRPATRAYGRHDSYEARPALVAPGWRCRSPGGAVALLLGGSGGPPRRRASQAEQSTRRRPRLPRALMMTQQRQSRRRKRRVSRQGGALCL